MHVGKKSQKREKSVMSVSLYGNVVFVVIELGPWQLQLALRQSSWTQSTMEWSFLCCFRPCS